MEQITAPNGAIIWVHLSHGRVVSGLRLIRTVGALQLIYVTGDVIEGFPEPGSELARHLERVLRAEAGRGLKGLAFRFSKQRRLRLAQRTKMLLQRPHAGTLRDSLP